MFFPVSHFECKIRTRPDFNISRMLLKKVFWETFWESFLNFIGEHSFNLHKTFLECPQAAVAKHYSADRFYTQIIDSLNMMHCHRLN